MTLAFTTCIIARHNVNGRVKPDHDKLIAIAAQAADLRLKPPYRFIPGVPSGTITAGSQRDDRV
jgi:hypothetical protein